MVLLVCECVSQTGQKYILGTNRVLTRVKSGWAFYC